MTDTPADAVARVLEQNTNSADAPDLHETMALLRRDAEWFLLRTHTRLPLEEIEVEAQVIEMVGHRALAVLDALAAREQEVDMLRADAACSTCGGAPHASGLLCICGGTNKAWREAQGLREELVKRKMAMGEYDAIPATWEPIANNADLRARLAALEEQIEDVRRLIASNGFAASFQTLGQYRTALLAEVPRG